MRSLKETLKKTKSIFTSILEKIFKGNINEELIEHIEEILIKADIGIETSHKLIEHLHEKIKKKEILILEQLKSALKKEILAILQNNEEKLNITENSLSIILVLGVNGVGKTTTIAKLSYKFQQEGKKVLLAACDTFRAAASDQLEIWAKRLNIDIVKHQSGSDPAAVAFDAVSAAKARKTDILIIDTAGRFHTQKNLIEELKKIKRVIEKNSDSLKEILLVLDATTGQNAISQAKIFQSALEVTGLIVTKLDGTAKGGMIFAIYDQLNIPIKLIGTGEAKEDLQVFDPYQFVEILFE